jgi:hypothetical protein
MARSTIASFDGAQLAAPRPKGIPVLSKQVNVEAINATNAGVYVVPHDEPREGVFSGG